MQNAQQQTAAQVQDQLRPIRNFIGLLSGATGEQNWAGEDMYAVNTPGRFYAYGPQGQSVEGQPIATTANGGIAISNGMVMLALGAGVAFLLLK